MTSDSKVGARNQMETKCFGLALSTTLCLHNLLDFITGWPHCAYHVEAAPPAQRGSKKQLRELGKGLRAGAFSCSTSVGVTNPDSSSGTGSQTMILNCCSYLSLFPSVSMQCSNQLATTAVTPLHPCTLALFHNSSLSLQPINLKTLVILMIATSRQGQEHHHIVTHSGLAAALCRLHGAVTHGGAHHGCYSATLSVTLRVPSLDLHQLGWALPVYCLHVSRDVDMVLWCGQGSVHNLMFTI